MSKKNKNTQLSTITSSSSFPPPPHPFSSFPNTFPFNSLNPSGILKQINLIKTFPQWKGKQTTLVNLYSEKTFNRVFYPFYMVPIGSKLDNFQYKFNETAMKRIQREEKKIKNTEGSATQVRLIIVFLYDKCNEYYLSYNFFT
jgi:hypothetical protein